MRKFPNSTGESKFPCNLNAFRFIVCVPPQCRSHRNSKQRLAHPPRGSATKKKAALPNDHTHPAGFLHLPHLPSKFFMFRLACYARAYTPTRSTGICAILIGISSSSGFLHRAASRSVVLREGGRIEGPSQQRTREGAYTRTCARTLSPSSSLQQLERSFHLPSHP